VFEKRSGQLSWNASCLALPTARTKIDDQPGSAGRPVFRLAAKVGYAGGYSIQGAGCLPDSVWSLALRPKEVIHLIFFPSLWVLPVLLLTLATFLALFCFPFPVAHCGDLFSLCLGDGFSRRPHESGQGYANRIMKATAELCNRMGLGRRWRRGSEDLDPSVELKWTQTKGAGDSGVLLQKRTQDLTELIPQIHTHTHTYTYRHSGGCLQASLHQMSFAFQQNNKMAVPSQRTKRHPKKKPKSSQHRNREGKGGYPEGLVSENGIVGLRISPWSRQKRKGRTWRPKR